MPDRLQAPMLLAPNATADRSLAMGRSQTMGS